MKTPKYLLIPGQVKSQHDHEFHFISTRDLVRLYGVDPEECVAWGEAVSREVLEELIPLGPRHTGDYSSHLQFLIQSRRP